MRKNKYQRDKSGHIIYTVKEKEDVKLKGTITEDAVATKNKFNALEVEENEQPTLMITDGKGEGNVKAQQKKQQEIEAKKVQQKVQLRNIEILSSNIPKDAGITVLILVIQGLGWRKSRNVERKIR